jgi:O-antigen ligase
VNQHQVEFKRDRQTLVDGEKSGWREFPPSVFEQMKRESLIIRTNGVDIANPMILLKLQRGRIHGTLVYPNALAGAILLLFPVTLALACFGTGTLRPPIRYAVIGLVAFLGFGCLFWTGSKSGWLIALGLLAAHLLQARIPRRLRLPLITGVAVVGLLAFAIRFQSYFSAGATSVGARFDYWSAAMKTTLAHPVVGTGPGTFQRPYAQLKSPDAEMARLVHNDYLQQFSDSGFPGGLFYLAWVGTLAVAASRHAFQGTHRTLQAIALGVLAWFAQGFVEFGLYLPALAWTGFTLAGVLAGLPIESSNRPRTEEV